MDRLEQLATSFAAHVPAEEVRFDGIKEVLDKLEVGQQVMRDNQIKMQESLEAIKARHATDDKESEERKQAGKKFTIAATLAVITAFLTKATEWITGLWKGH